MRIVSIVQYETDDGLFCGVQLEQDEGEDEGFERLSDVTVEHRRGCTVLTVCDTSYYSEAGSHEWATSNKTSPPDPEWASWKAYLYVKERLGW